MCLYEKSCGAVIFYKSRQNTKILLVKNSNGRYWSFPKGHIEDGENEHQTAIREIKEETGLDVVIEKGFREIKSNTVLSVKFANGLSFSLHRHLRIMSKFRRRKLTVIFGLICNRHEKCAPMIMI